MRWLTRFWVAIHAVNIHTIVCEEYSLIKRRQLSPDTFLLRFALPRQIHSKANILGLDSALPTCISITVPEGTDIYENGNPTQGDLSKSYSPISHPATLGYFELIVKAYPPREGGGVGRYLTHYIQVADETQSDDTDTCTDAHSVGTCTSSPPPVSIKARLKAPREVHGSPAILNRWQHIGLVAGGTGIAPLIQIASLILDSNSKIRTSYPEDNRRLTTIHVLYINRYKEDILYKEQLDRWSEEYPEEFIVSYSLTGNRSDDHEGQEKFFRGRGSAEMAKSTLPAPKIIDEDGIETFSNSMIFVCGTDGFVKSWGGSIGRAPPKMDGSKGPKIQGPLEGWLKEVGFSADQVFKY